MITLLPLLLCALLAGRTSCTARAASGTLWKGERFGAEIDRVTYSSDGKTMADVTSSGSVIEFRRVSNGQVLGTLTDRNILDGDVVAMSLSSDGSKLAFLAGGEIHIFYEWYGCSYCTDVRYSPDGELRAMTVNAYESDILIPGQPFYTTKVLAAIPDKSPFMDFTPDGKSILTWGNTLIQLWDAKTGELLRTLAEGNPAQTRRETLALSPDGQTFAYLRDGIQVRRISDGALIRTLPAPPSPVTALAISPGAPVLASGSADGTLQVWSLRDGTPITTFDAHDAEITSVKFTPDGTTLVTTGRDGAVKLWETGTYRLKTTQISPYGSVPALQFSGDGRTLASLHWESGIQLWRSEDGAPLRSFSGPFTAVGLGQSPPTLVGLRGVTVEVRDPDSGERMKGYTLPLPDTGSYPYVGLIGLHRAIFSPDRGLFAVSVKEPHDFSGERGIVADGYVQIRNLSDGSLRAEIGKGQGYARDMAFSPDGKMLAVQFAKMERINQDYCPPPCYPVATFNESGPLILFEAETGKLLRDFSGMGIDLGTLAFSPDGRLLAAGGSDVRIIDWQKKVIVSTTNGDEHMSKNSLAFSPDGQFLAGGGGLYNRYFYFWRVEDGKLVKQVETETDGALTVAFSPQGDRVAYGGKGPAVTVLKTPALPPSVRLLGDVNDDGTVDVGDVVSLLRYLVKLDSFTPTQEALADVSKDTTIDVRDAYLILLSIIGYEPLE
jgi:WD40 repeat protein